MDIIKIDHSESSLVIDLFNKYRIFYKQPSNMELCRKFITDRLKNNESVIFVATTKENEKIVPTGFTQLYPKFSSGKAIKIWVLNDLYVDENYRNRGIGENLIHRVLTFVKDDNANHVELSTATDNYHAQRLYETIGFEKQVPNADFLSYKINLT
ncbi:MAG: GNAT family N-acetyltransferase [Pelobium sp.]